MAASHPFKPAPRPAAFLHFPSCVSRSRAHGEKNPYKRSYTVSTAYNSYFFFFPFHSDPLIFRLFDRHCIGRVCMYAHIGIHHIEIERGRLQSPATSQPPGRHVSVMSNVLRSLRSHVDEWTCGEGETASDTSQGSPAVA